MAVSLIPILLHPETVAPLPAQKPTWRTLVQFFRLPGHWQWLLMLALYTAGGSMASGMIHPLMVDRGFSLSDIGWILGIVSFSAGLVGSLIAGWLINCWGCKRSLIRFGIFSAIAIATYLPIGFGSSDLVLVYGSNILVAIATGMAFTVTLAVMMDYSRLETASTDYTVQVSVVYFSGILAMALGGLIAQALGYVAVFVVCVGLTLLGVALVHKGFTEQKTVMPANNVRSEASAP